MSTKNFPTGSTPGTLAAGDDPRFTALSDATLNVSRLTLTPTSTKMGAYPAAVQELVVTDASGGSFTVTLPASPADGSLIEVKKIDSSNNLVTVATSGSDAFSNSATSTSLQIQGQSITVYYQLSTNTWIGLSTSIPLTGLDSRFATPSGVDSAIASSPLVTGKASKGANSDITSLSGMTTALSLSQGGTGGITALSARTNLGLGTSATFNIGSTSGTVAAGDDSRFATIAGNSSAVTKLTLTPTATKTGPYTANVQELVLTDASGGAFTVTLPTAPVDGTLLEVKKVDSSANAVTVVTGGSDAFSTGTTSATLIIQGQSITIYYQLSTNKWIGLSNNVPLSGLDARFASTSAVAIKAASGANADITSLTGLTTALSLAQGGTGGTSASSARTNLGLGTSATLNIGSTSGTIAAGDDSRFSTIISNTTAVAKLTLTPTATKTGSYTASVQELVLTDASSGAFNVTLPTTPADGSLVEVKKIDSSTNAVTVLTGGSDAFSTGTTSAMLIIQSQSITIYYQLSTNKWIGLSNNVPLSGLDARFASTSAVAAKAASGTNSDITSLTGLTTALSLAQGGTGGTSATAARTSLGLGTAATLNVGSTTGTVAAGDDARLAAVATNAANISKITITPTSTKTAAYTAAIGDFVVANATSTAFTVTLPTAPVDGALIGVKKIDASVNAVTVTTGGSDTFSIGSTTVALVLQGQAITVRYIAASAMWVGLSSDLPLVATDARYLSQAAALTTYAPIASPTFTGTTTLGGAFVPKRTSVSDAAYTVLASDYIIEYTALTVGRGVTLPSAIGITGRHYIIKDGTGLANSYNITVSPASGQTIEGSTARNINKGYGYMWLYSDGANWRTISNTTTYLMSPSTTDLGTLLSNLGFRFSTADYSLTSSGSFNTSGTMVMTGGVISGQTTITASATYTTAAYGKEYIFANSPSAITVTLPSTTNVCRYTIKNINTGTVTVNGTIDGATGYSLAQYKFVTLAGSGTSGSWYIVGSN